MPAWVLSAFSNFLPKSQTMHARSVEQSKLSVGMHVSGNGCLSMWVWKMNELCKLWGVFQLLLKIQMCAFILVILVKSLYLAFLLLLCINQNEKNTFRVMKWLSFCNMLKNRTGVENLVLKIDCDCNHYTTHNPNRRPHCFFLKRKRRKMSLLPKTSPGVIENTLIECKQKW